MVRVGVPWMFMRNWAGGFEDIVASEAGKYRHLQPRSGELQVTSS
jgi:hypothetical protein